MCEYAVWEVGERAERVCEVPEVSYLSITFGPSDAYEISWLGAAKPSIVARSVRVRRGVWDIGIGAARGMERRERGNTLLFPVPLVEKTEKIDGPVLPMPPLGREHQLQREHLPPLPFSPQRLDFNILNRNLYLTQVSTRTRTARWDRHHSLCSVHNVHPRLGQVERKLHPRHNDVAQGDALLEAWAIPLSGR